LPPVYAGEHGVGERYEHTFNCVHCKSIDHPGGLCPFAKGSSNNGIGDSDSDDDLLPKKKGKAPQFPKPDARKEKNRAKDPTPKGGNRPGPSGQRNTMGTERAAKRKRTQDTS